MGKRILATVRENLETTVTCGRTLFSTNLKKHCKTLYVKSKFLPHKMFILRKLKYGRKIWAKYQKKMKDGPFGDKKIQKSCTVPKQIDRGTLQNRRVSQMHAKVCSKQGLEPATAGFPSTD